MTTMDGCVHDIGTWDLLIAHPPCTYLSNAGARHLYKNHQWRWYGAASLMQMAAEGVKQPKDCNFTVTVDSLEVLDAIEILPCTDAAVKSIEAVKPWKV